MYPYLRFKDTAVIYPVTANDYGKDVLGEGQSVSALFEQTTGFSHGNYRDSITASSRLYLTAQDQFIKDNYFRLEGMIVKVNPFDGVDSEQYFRITSVTPGRDLLNNNVVRHVECELTKTTDFGNEDES